MVDICISDLSAQLAVNLGQEEGRCTLHHLTTNLEVGD